MKRITIARWKEMGEFLKDTAGIKKFIYGAQDEDIAAKVERIKLSEYPVLVGILPTITGTGNNFDNLGHESPLFFYCMVPAANLSDDETDAAWESTLEGIRNIERVIQENSNNSDWREFYNINPSTIHIDPEYNMWGLMGWSIGFEIEHVD